MPLTTEERIFLVEFVFREGDKYTVRAQERFKEQFPHTKSVEVFRKDPFLALFFSLSSLMIIQPLCLLPSAALYADNLAIWSSVPTAVEATQGALFRLKRCLSTGVFLSIRANVRPPQWIPTKLISSPTSSYSAPASVLIQVLATTRPRFVLLL